VTHNISTASPQILLPVQFSSSVASSEHNLAKLDRQILLFCFTAFTFLNTTGWSMMNRYRWYRMQMNEIQRIEQLSLSWNSGKIEQICTVKFQNFLGVMSPVPVSAIRRFAPPCFARGLRSFHHPSLSVVDIFSYFSPWHEIEDVCRGRWTAINRIITVTNHILHSQLPPPSWYRITELQP